MITMRTWIVFLFPLVIIFDQHVDGYTVSGNIYDTDGSSSDVQAAIDAASDGATVVIPDGSYVWSQPVTINGFLHVVAQNYGQVTITRTYTGGDLLTMNASTAGSVELAGIVFTSNMNGASDNYSFTLMVNQLGGLPVLVHDCSFTTGYEYAIGWWGNGGVIWNCSFYTYSDLLGGISFVNTSQDDSYWNQPDSMGASGDPSGTLNTYVEDCSFYDAKMAMANFDDNSRVVWRHNLMSNAILASHGQETSIWGTRHWEIYGNTFVYSTSGTAFGGDSYPLTMDTWFELRGGTGVVTGNVMPDIPWGKAGIQLNVFSINRADSIPCQTGYPAAHQTGQGWSASSNATFGTPVVSYDGTGAVLDPLYVWGNTGTETSDPGYVFVNQYSPDDCGFGEQIGVFLQQNRDYFVDVAKPGWSPFTYPHPLRWSSQLENAMAANGWSNAQINALSGFLAADSPRVDSQNSYAVWEGEINWDLQQGGFSGQQVQQFDSWVEANAP